MIKSLFRKTPNFIEVYDGALSKKECEILIGQFEKSDKLRRGMTSKGYSPEHKNCLELYCIFNESNIINNILRPKLFSYLGKYVSEQRFSDDKSALDLISKWKYSNDYQIQKYDGEDDGYKDWHCEQGPDKENSRRILAWMFYLNDAKCGTEFAYFPTVNAKMGRLVIWPSSWTHLHKGVIPNKGVKYIATGWVEYKKEV
jgi:hypothetical protein